MLVLVHEYKVRTAGNQYVCNVGYDWSVVLVERKTSHGKSNYSITMVYLELPQSVSSQ